MVDISRYTDRITSEHADKPKYMAMVGAVAQMFVDVQTFMIPGLMLAFDLDTATGIQLDQVGEWIGRSRDVSFPISGIYFSWDTQGLGWDQGNWKGQFDANTGITALDDDTYRNLLRAKIILNHTKGTIDDAAAAITELFSEFPGTIVSIKDNQDMTMTISISGVVPPVVYLALLDNGELVITPTGVSATFTVTSVNSVALFGWDTENATISGWDVGAWSGAIGVGPGQVTSVALVSSTSTTVTLSWLPPTVGAAASSYQIEYRLSGSTSPFQLIGPPVTKTQATVSGSLIAGNSYEFEVYAVNNAGAGQPSPPLVVTIPTGNVSQVTGLQTASTPTASTVPLSWNSLGAGVTYTVQQRPSGTGNFATITTTTQTTYTATGLSAGTQYDFQVFATSGTSGPPSVALTVSTAGGTTTPAPSVVQNVAASTVGQNDAIISWSAPATGASGATYSVFYALSGPTPTYKPFTGSIVVAGTVISMDITGLQPSTAYLVQVQATNAGGAGPMSPAITVTTLGVTPLQVTGLTLVSDTPTSATISWNAASQATSYQVQYQQPGDTTWTNGPLIAAPATSATVTFPSTVIITPPPASGGATVTVTQTANNVVVRGVGPSITDAGGNNWYIGSNGQVGFNGTLQGNTSGVTSIAYVGGTVWQENGAAGTWYSFAVNNGVESVTAGPLPSPFTGKTSPADTLQSAGTIYVVSAQYTNVLPGNPAFIIDDQNNLWGINGSNQVTINGVADTSTSNVSQLVYVGGVVWRQLATGLWYNKTNPTASWLPSGGTATSPVPAGTSTTPAILNPSTTVTTTQTVTRPWQWHPGTQYNFWNTPLGKGAKWGLTTDADTIDLRNGGFINAPDNFGSPVYVGSASDPLCTVTNGGLPVVHYGNVPENNWTKTFHLPRGASSAGPHPGDQAFNFIDPVNYPGKYFFAGPLDIENYQGGGNFTTPLYGSPTAWEDEATTDLYANSVECKTDTYSNHCGCIRGAWDLDSTKNKARIPGTNLPRIQHVLRYSHSNNYLKRNDVNNNNDILYPDSWPKLFQDYQGGVTGANDTYSGNLKYGTHVGIPSNVQPPATLTDAGRQLFDALQCYGACIGDQSGGGFHVFADQDACANSTWYNNANNDLVHIIVPLLLPLRNQHKTGDNWIDFPPNGPGDRMDSGPPPLGLLPGFPVPSPNFTSVTSSSTTPITDSMGTTWGCNAAGQVTVNGVADTTTANVVQVAYVNGVIHHKNTAGLWYGKMAPWSAWSAGSTATPLTGNVQTPTGNTLPDGGVTYNFRVYAIGA